MRQYLFAYGTLQPGLAPTKIARVAAKLRPVGEGFVRGVLYDLGGYPGAVADPSAMGKIAGTVMELPEEEGVLERLDRVRGIRSAGAGDERVHSREADCGVEDGRHGGVLVLPVQPEAERFSASRERGVGEINRDDRSHNSADASDPRSFALGLCYDWALVLRGDNRGEAAREF